MINEAIYALYEGVAGVEEIDTVMKLGMAHPMGPLQLADFIGLDVCLFILKVMHEGFGNPKYAPCPLLVNMVQAGHKGIKSGNGFYTWSHGTKDLVVADRFKKIIMQRSILIRTIYLLRGIYFIYYGLAAAPKLIEQNKIALKPAKGAEKEWPVYGGKPRPTVTPH